jgi:hypothetical protein
MARDFENPSGLRSFSLVYLKEMRIHMIEPSFFVRDSASHGVQFGHPGSGPDPQPGAEPVSGLIHPSESIQPTVDPIVIFHNANATPRAKLIDDADLEAGYHETFMKQAAVAEVVTGRSFRSKCAIFTASLAGRAISGMAIINVRIFLGTRENRLEGTPAPTLTPTPTLAPTQDLETLCAEECQGISPVPVMVNGFEFKQPLCTT